MYVAYYCLFVVLNFFPEFNRKKREKADRLQMPAQNAEYKRT